MKGMYSKLPRSVKIKNERFIINTDFRIFITYEEEMMQGIDKKKAIYKALNSFFPAFSLIIKRNMINEAADKFIWFYKCGKEELPRKSGSGSNKEAFRYSYDDLYIWGAFKQYYNVDLSMDHIHWWKFRAMWLSLPDDAEINKIKGYRTYNGKEKDILELQEYYKLPLSEKQKQESERHNKLYEMLK